MFAYKRPPAILQIRSAAPIRYDVEFIVDSFKRDIYYACAGAINDSGSIVTLASSFENQICRS